MKKIKILIASLLIGSVAYTQQPPQGNAGGGAFWRKGGNTGPFGSPNKFGTAAGNNSPIYTITDGDYRMKLNGDLNYNVNGINGQRDGFLLLGNNSAFGGGGDLYNSANRGAYSLLHLNGDPGFIQEFGYRGWMRTGVTFTDNDDLTYIGLRAVDNTADLTETTITMNN